MEDYKELNLKITNSTALLEENTLCDFWGLEIYSKKAELLFAYTYLTTEETELVTFVETCTRHNIMWPYVMEVLEDFVQKLHF